MKKLTLKVHYLVSMLGLDKMLARYSAIIPFLRKFIPTNKEYSAKKYVCVKRGKVNFNLQLNDYMQWHVFACMPEPLWEASWKGLKNNAVIFDVGANVGAFTLKGAGYLLSKNLEYEIFAFEPNIEVATKLENNINLNPRCENNIHIENYALSDQRGEMYFEYSANNSGAGKLTNMPMGTKVNVISLDEYCQIKSITKIDLIKIDVEGFEPLVLKGAHEVINKLRPSLIIEITEEWFKANGASSNEIIYCLENLGYKLYCDIEGRISPLSSYNKNTLSFQFNLLAIHD